MKRITIEFIIFLFCNNLLHSQVYHPMVIEGVTWIYAPGNYHETKSYGGYTLSGDTIINNQEYKKNTL